MSNIVVVVLSIYQPQTKPRPNDAFGTVLSVQLLARILTIYISELVSGKLPPEISYPSRLVHF